MRSLPGRQVDSFNGKVAKIAKIANFFGMPPGDLETGDGGFRAIMLYKYVYYQLSPFLSGPRAS
jgi:hypothetical protein